MIKITDKSDATYREFAERLDEVWRGWERGFDEGAAFYSDDPETRIWDGTVVKGPGKEAYAAAGREAYVEGVAELQNTGGPDLQVFREGDLAVTVTTLRNVGRTKDGQEFDETMRETLVWAPDGEGDWRIVHEHTSPLPEGSVG